MDAVPSETERPGRGLLALTVDVEEWYTGIADRPSEMAAHASRLSVGLERLLALLDSHDTRATFFVVGYLARENPSLVRRIADAGHELGVHDDYHIPLWDRNATQFRESVTKALESVEQSAGTGAKRYRAPCFSIDERTLWALDVLEELEFEYDSSIFPVRNPRYGYPGAPRFPYRVGRDRQLLEFPVSTLRIGPFRLPFSGGFYLRALPISAVSMGLQRLLSQGRPGLCYIHPWELDVEQPKLKGPPGYRLRHGLGLRTTERKLGRLLQRFRFDTAGAVLQSLDL